MSAPATTRAARTAELYALATKAEQFSTEVAEASIVARDPGLHALARALFGAMLHLRDTLNTAGYLPDDPRARLQFDPSIAGAYHRLKLCELELDRAVEAWSSRAQRARAGDRAAEVKRRQKGERDELYRARDWELFGDAPTDSPSTRARVLLRDDEMRARLKTRRLAPLDFDTLRLKLAPIRK